jgi:putative phosphoesterase
MKILIVSDSHGNKEILLGAIEKEKPDKIFFLGDYISDILDIKDLIPSDICAVKGNTDRGSNGPEDMILNINNLKMFLTHGHKYNVSYNMHKLYLKAQENSVNYVFFGHTHIYDDFIKNGIRFINPGSISKPRGQEFGTYVIANIKDSEINFIKKVLT